MSLLTQYTQDDALFAVQNNDIETFSDILSRECLSDDDIMASLTMAFTLDQLQIIDVYMNANNMSSHKKENEFKLFKLSLISKNSIILIDEYFDIQDKKLMEYIGNDLEFNFYLDIGSRTNRALPEYLIKSGFLVENETLIKAYAQNTLHRIIIAENEGDITLSDLQDWSERTITETSTHLPSKMIPHVIEGMGNIIASYASDAMIQSIKDSNIKSMNDVQNLHTKPQFYKKWDIDNFFERLVEHPNREIAENLLNYFKDRQDIEELLNYDIVRCIANNDFSTLTSSSDIKKIASHFDKNLMNYAIDRGLDLGTVALLDYFTMLYNVSDGYGFIKSYYAMERKKDIDVEKLDKQMEKLGLKEIRDDIRKMFMMHPDATVNSFVSFWNGEKTPRALKIKG